MVPGLSILFMAVSALISIGLPVGLFLYWRKRHALKVMPMLIGAAAFILFALILESLLHQIVLRPGPDGSVALIRESPWLFVFYGAFAAGIFEETARFISFKFLKKRYDGVGTGLSYGIGHGGIEAIAIAGLAMISNIILSISINAGLTGMMGEIDGSAALAAINALTQTAPSMFLVSGLERAIAISIHISLSMFVWVAVRAEGKVWLFPAAILLHAAIDVPVAMYQTGMIQSIAVVEGIVLAVAALCALAAYKVCMLWGSDPAELTLEKIDSLTSGNANEDMS